MHAVHACADMEQLYSSSSRKCICILVHHVDKLLNSVVIISEYHTVVMPYMVRHDSACIMHPSDAPFVIHYIVHKQLPELTLPAVKVYSMLCKPFIPCRCMSQR